MYVKKITYICNMKIKDLTDLTLLLTLVSGFLMTAGVLGRIFEDYIGYGLNEQVLHGSFWVFISALPAYLYLSYKNEKDKR